MTKATLHYTRSMLLSNCNVSPESVMSLYRTVREFRILSVANQLTYSPRIALRWPDRGEVDRSGIYPSAKDSYCPMIAMRTLRSLDSELQIDTALHRVDFSSDPWVTQHCHQDM